MKNHYNSLAAKYGASKRSRKYPARSKAPVPPPVQRRAVSVSATASVSVSASEKTSASDGGSSHDDDNVDDDDSAYVEENENEIALRSLAEVAGI